ncbi:hypothetical protein GEMRC1_012708 [Eukaryota sp. GEM-RC1]
MAKKRSHFNLVCEFLSSHISESTRVIALQLLLLVIGVLGCALSVSAVAFPNKLINFAGFWTLSLIFLLLKPYYPYIDRLLFGQHAPAKYVSYSAFGLILLSTPFYLIMFCHLHLYLLTLPPSLALFPDRRPRFFLLHFKQSFYLRDLF